jgi:cell division septum initiation protein DivIVA
MASQSINSEHSEDSMMQAQAELLEILLQSDDAVYPWNPAELNGEAYFAELESEFPLDGWFDEEISRSAQTMFERLDQCWTTVSPTNDALKESLTRQFAARVPAGLLEAIAEKAKQVFSANLSMADQLVQCVQQLLPNWEEEDLLVFARPLAYAMRGNQVMPTGNWPELSEIERARLSLVIAHTALTQLSDDIQSQES